MSKRSWVYGVDAKDNPLSEELDAAQGNADENVLKQFSTLETRVSNAQSISDEASKRVLADIEKLVNTLPKHRKAHWIGELERIGAITKAPSAPAKESTGGGK